MQNRKTEILPIHLAHRGFEIGLPVEYIFKCIDAGLHSGQIERPAFRTWPGDEPIHLDRTPHRLVRWKRQFEAGARIEIPETWRPEIDWALGVIAVPE